MPKIKVVLDNDVKGREIYSKIQSNSGNIKIEKNNTNNEIEDFLYPEVIVYLINLLLERKSMVRLKSSSVCKKIHTPSLAIKGILEVCEYEKDSLNPDNGAELSFISSGSQTNRVKEGLAGMFNLKANKNLLSLIGECDKKYPYVRQALQKLCDFKDVT